MINHNNFLIFLRKHPQVWLFILAVLAFFQVSFFMNPVKHDMIDCFYPWRFHIGECLQNGQLPWWNPYQDLGYPIHADPSSGGWYPMVWLIGFFNGYNLWSLGFELWIHVFFAGIGFYVLARTLHFDQRFALLAGMAYMLSGLFIGNAQHLPYIISAAWLPFVLNFYFKMVRENGWINSLKAAFFLFLMITGGYPAFTIILFYLLLIFSLIYFIQKLKTFEKRIILHFIAKHALFLMYTILLSLVLLTAIAQVSPYLSRLGDFDLTQALFSPFSPQSFISFVLPYTTTTDTNYFNSDISMRNAYFGIFTFLFFILGLFSKKPLEIRVLFYFGIFALIASVGEYLPVREFLFKYIPMMNVFRFPSVFRLFFIIGGILTAVYFIQQYFSKEPSNRRILIWGTVSLILLFTVFIIRARIEGPFNLQGIISGIFTANNSLSYFQHAAFQAIIQTMLLGIFLLVLVRFKATTKVVTSLIALVALDLFLATQLNGPYTVYYDMVKAKDASASIARLPKGFPPLQTHLTIGDAGHLPGLGLPFWQNLNSFQKQVSAEGFNSFSFSSYEDLERDYPEFFEEIKKNSLLLLSDSIHSISELPDYKKAGLFNRQLIFLDSNEYSYLKQRTFGPSYQGDTAAIQDYDASHFSIRTNLKNRRLLTLFQKEYTGWKAYIDGKKTRIFKSNMNFMTIKVPSGQHTIRFEYKNPGLKLAFWISSGSLIAFVCMLIWQYMQSAKKKNQR